jgi:hypothetical protein
MNRDGSSTAFVRKNQGCNGTLPRSGTTGLHGYAGKFRMRSMRLEAAGPPAENLHCPENKVDKPGRFHRLIAQRSLECATPVALWFLCFMRK